MNRIKVISFDAEGTLVTPQFSRVIWHEAMPALYAREKGASLVWAKEFVESEYEKVSDQNLDWYDIKYWVHRFGFNGYREMFDEHRGEISYYPEVEEVLSSLARSYRLIVTSSSTREFLDLFFARPEKYFSSVFSTISDYRMTKSPDLYLKICQVMEVRPQEMVHVGDNLNFDFVVPQSVGVHALYLDREKDGKGYQVVRNLAELEEKLPG